MLKYLFVLVCATAAFCYEDYQQYEPYEEEILVPAEDLPAGSIVRIRRQVFGGVSSLPGGGYNQQFGARGSVFSTPTKDLSAWGSLSQSANSRGFTSPITYSGGLDFNTARGHGLSASALHVPNAGSQATLGGKLNVLNTPNHNLNAFASHTKTFDPNFHQVGRGSSTAGLGYQHVGGAGLTVSGTHTPGLPNTGSISSTLPLHTDKTTSINLNTQSNFASGQKPNHFIGLSATKTF